MTRTVTRTTNHTTNNTMTNPASDITTPLDFRSDTVTQPTAAMRKAMHDAPVGDDVLEEDPTVNRLEALVAERFQREAALFVPSGTMANLIAVALHVPRGGEVICERRTHTFKYEAGGGSALFGASFWTLDCDRGYLSPTDIHAAVRADDIHCPRSKLVIVENTANLAGGVVVDLATLTSLTDAAHQHGMALHLDGARIWNASIAAATPLHDFGRAVDTLSCCLSKGLGCPAGSLFVGNRDAILEARRMRKMLGGGMRQVGILAAAGIYALENHFDRIADDHALAKEVANVLRARFDNRYRVQEPQTNIVLLHTENEAATEEAMNRLTKAGVLCFALRSTLIRLVTSLALPHDAAKLLAARLA